MNYLISREPDSDYIEHYGVLGMKWGRRKAIKFAAKAERARKAGNKELATKYKEKSKRLESKHMRRAGGKKSYDYSGKESLGKSIGKTLIFGTYGTLRYNEVKAKERGRGKAVVAGLIGEIGNGFTGGLLGIVEPRLRDKNGNL